MINSLFFILQKLFIVFEYKNIMQQTSWAAIFFDTRWYSLYRAVKLFDYPLSDYNFCTVWLLGFDLWGEFPYF